MENTGHARERNVKILRSPAHNSHGFGKLVITTATSECMLFIPTSKQSGLNVLRHSHSRATWPGGRVTLPAAGEASEAHRS